MTRGFITVATGKYYCWLAQNLAMSYRLFSDRKYPFYVITDKKGKSLLKEYFDGIIVLENPNYNFLDKIEVYYNSPFDETVFMDSDMSVIKDISCIFDYFEDNGSEVSCCGMLRDITNEERPNHFGDAAIKYYNLKQYIRFGGGIYYYKKSEKADELIDYVFNYLIPHYDDLELLHIGSYFGNDIKKMADEPLMGLAMIVKGMKPNNKPDCFMRYYRGNMMETLQWDMKNKDCSFFWWGEIVHPYIAHYATYNTYTYKYYKNAGKLYCIYKKIPNVIKPIILFIYDIKWLFSNNTKKEIREWLKAHFSISYIKNKIKHMFCRQ